ncbi:MAG: hypothetical protein U0132_12150 [Gemmatimonadaceae bacterium]
MKQRWAAHLVVLALFVFLPRGLVAQQGSQPGREKGISLGQNYPNPFNPETTIPFTIGGGSNCADPGKQYRVSLRIYNVLAQLVAVPRLQGGDANVSGGTFLENVYLTCGEYTAWWNGKVGQSEREVSSGIYIYRLEVDGKPFLKKMIVQK